ncbi:MAG: 2-C-methyl-D-erythritol 4-phosphate cytidylyltransferase [Lachnospiraceae bacterium]|nr:2-C-methyl-D-erythritol 4-phosphate cytidylyltransferase [Lachnospiraceae bacterium]
MNKKKTAAVVLAAGQGKRMGAGKAKQFLLLDGKPVLYYALQAFEESVVDSVVLVTGCEEIEYCQKEIVDFYGFKKVQAIVAGGKERYHSVANGLQAIKELPGETEVVLIHDGARPFVTPEMIRGLVEETRLREACVIGTPVKDTIKIADDDGFCAQTPPRNKVWAVQTPQSFSFDLVSNAYALLIDKEQELLEQGVQITDDAMVVEYMTEKRVRLVEGDYTNIKLTTPEDMVIAEAFLQKRKK